MNREEIIMQLLISLNQGNSGYINERVRYAIEQYDKLVKEKILTETTNATHGKPRKNFNEIICEGANNEIF